MLASLVIDKRIRIINRELLDMSCFKYRIGDSIRLKTWTHGEPIGEAKEVFGFSNYTGQNMYIIEGESELIEESLLVGKEKNK